MKKNLKTPTKIKRKRKLGFLARMSTKHGAQVLNRRRRKGRKTISA